MYKIIKKNFKNFYSYRNCYANGLVAILLKISNNRFIIMTACVASLVGGLSLQAKTVGSIIKNIEKAPVSLPKTRSASRKTKATKVDLKLVSPTSSVNSLFKEGTNEAEYEKLLNQQISQLYALSRKTRSKSMQGDVWLRLGKAYTEKSALVEQRINENFDKKMEQYFDKKRSSKPRLDMSPAQTYNKKAIELYRWYLRDNPRSPSSDQVLFFLGYNTMALGDDSASVKYYEALSKRYPKSEFVVEANLSLADYYFDQGSKNYSQSRKNYLKAERFYKKIIQSRSRLSSIATYKLAWVNLKLGRSTRALSYITRVIRDGKFKDQRKVSSERLAREAQKELPMFYSQVSDYKKAVPYFKASLPKNDVAKSLEQLALLYADSGNRDGAGYLFDYLSRTGDLSVEKVFDFQLKKVQLAETKGGIVNSRTDLLDLIDGFGPNTRWAKKARKKQVYEVPYRKMESLLKNYALSTHKESRLRKDNLNSMRKADEAYRLYEKNFAKEDTTGEMKFFHAELLYEANQFEKSADIYGEIAKSKNSKYAEKAQLNALLAIEKVLPSIDDIKKKVGSSTKIYPLSKVEKKFVTLTKEYLADPKNKESRVEVQYKLASLLYSHNYLDEAEKEFKVVIKEHPKTQYAEYSTNLILDIYSLRKDYKGLERVGNELLDKNSVKDEKTLAEVKSVVEKSAFKSAEMIEKSGEPIDAAKAYLEFYKKYPKSTLGSLALYNSAINFEKADRKLLAIESYERYRAISNLQQQEYRKTYLFSGILKESLGDLPGAARDYEAYIKVEDPKNIEPSLYYNIAVIYEGLKNFSKVTSYLNLYSQKAGSNEVENIDFRIASYADSLSLVNEAISYYKKYISNSKADKKLRIESVGRLAHLYRSAGNNSQMRSYFEQSIKLQSSNSSKENAKYAAEAMFLKTDKIYDDLKSVTISRNPKTQQSQVQQKIKMIEDLRKSTEKVIAYDVPEWIVAALTKMGQGYQHLAYSLVSAPVPKDLNSAEAIEYRAKIAEIANPFKLNAIRSYQNAIDRAKSLSGFGPYYKIAREELFNLSPDSTYLADETSYVLLNYDSSLENSDVTKLLKGAGSDESKVFEALGRILEKDSSNALAHEFMAKYYYDKSMYHMAKIYLSKIEKSADSARVFNNLGFIHQKLAAQDDAQKYFEKAINKDPSYVLARANFTAKFVLMDGFTPILSDLESLYKKTKSRVSKEEFSKKIAINYAVALARVRQFGESADVYKKLLRSYPKDLAILKNLSLVLVTGEKNKVEGAQVLGQFKSIARTQKDLNNIKSMEGYLKSL